jgi:hypothetical protein
MDGISGPEFSAQSIQGQKTPARFNSAERGFDSKNYDKKPRYGLVPKFAKLGKTVLI